MKRSDLQLGDLAKCTITGYTGVVIARTDWLNGCLRFVLQSPKLNKDGLPADPTTFDGEQLELVKKGVRAVSSPGGGPMPDPVR